MEKYIIPTHADQTASGTTLQAGDLRAGVPAAQQLPSPLDTSVSVGSDPLYSELTSNLRQHRHYGMHWLLDVDNTYGFGHCGDQPPGWRNINTYQRGPQESVFETSRSHPAET